MSSPRASHAARLAGVTERRREALLERAALIFDGCPGVTWDEADDLAWTQEGRDQRSLFGGVE